MILTGLCVCRCVVFTFGIKPNSHVTSVLALCRQDMRRLETALQRYAWGKRGSRSMVAKLKKVTNEVGNAQLEF